MDEEKKGQPSRFKRWYRKKTRNIQPDEQQDSDDSQRLSDSEGNATDSGKFVQESAGWQL